MEGVFLHNYSETYIFATLNQRQYSFGVVSTLCFCWVKVSETSGQVLFFFFFFFFFFFVVVVVLVFFFSGERFNGANETKLHK